MEAFEKPILAKPARSPIRFPRAARRLDRPRPCGTSRQPVRRLRRQGDRGGAGGLPRTRPHRGGRALRASARRHGRDGVRERPGGGDSLRVGWLRRRSASAARRTPPLRRRLEGLRRPRPERSATALPALLRHRHPAPGGARRLECHRRRDAPRPLRLVRDGDPARRARRAGARGRARGSRDRGGSDGPGDPGPRRSHVHGPEGAPLRVVVPRPRSGPAAAGLRRVGPRRRRVLGRAPR